MLLILFHTFGKFNFDVCVLKASLLTRTLARRFDQAAARQAHPATSGAAHGGLAAPPPGARAFPGLRRAGVSKLL